MDNHAVFLSSVTHSPGVYQMLDVSGKVIYVGKARNLKKRLSSYFSASAKDPKTTALMRHVVDVTITVTQDENEALLLECNLIKKHHPHYNILFRDDKSYPYIHLTGDTFPRVTFYRGNRKPAGHYFGPWPSTIAVREAIHVIEKFFKIRNCSNTFFAARSRPCIQYEIDRCTAPCVKYVSALDYTEQVRHTILFLQGKDAQVIDELQRQMEQAAATLSYEKAGELRDLIGRLRELHAQQSVSGVSGNADVLGMAVSAGVVCLQLIMIRAGRMLGSRALFPVLPAHAAVEEILTAFISQHYLDAQKTLEIPSEIIVAHTLPETDWLSAALSQQVNRKISIHVPHRGQKYQWLTIANKSAQQSLATRLLEGANTRARAAALCQLLNLTGEDLRFECMDISHTMGEATVGACVVFGLEGARKSDYRRYNINGITPGDDLAAMTQVLQRRFRVGGTAKLPEVLFIDGGKPQLTAVQHCLAALGVEISRLVGVAKGATRKPGFETLYFIDQSAIHLPADSLALHFIQQIRDESHRFAITGHRARRDKKRVTSTLELIAGVGARRRRDLLRHFGGIQGVNRASLEALAQVPGVGRALAEKIYAALHT